jgi:hypothetical protein
MGKELRMAVVLVATGWIALPVHADESVAACKLLSDAEIRKLAGPAVQDWQFQLPRDGSPLGGGGSECEIPGFSVQLDAAPVEQYQARMKIWTNAKFVPMSGIGDEAHYYVQGGDYAGVYTRVGKRMLVVSRSLMQGETPASVRPLLESVAKAIVAKLK